MKGPFIKNILNEKPVNSAVTVKGWIRTKRESKNFCFIEINDGSCLNNLQIIINGTIKNYDEILSDCNTGASVEAIGKIVESAGAKQSIELQAESLTVIGKCPQDEYVLQKKHHSFEYLRTIGHLRPEPIRLVQ